MKNLFISFAFAGLLFYGPVSLAQNISIGFRGGLSIPNLTAGKGNQNPLNTGYSSRLGPDVGLFAEFGISELFSLQPMLEYSSQGGKKSGLQAFTTPDQIAGMYPAGQAPPYIFASYDSEAKLDYLILPVLAKFGWDIKKSPLRIYIDAGPFIGFLVSAHQVTSGRSLLYADAEAQQALPGGSQSFDNTENVKDNLHKFNTGIEGNVGVNYRFGLNNIFIEGGGNFGFLNIQKNGINGKNRTGAAIITVGYSYYLGDQY